MSDTPRTDRAAADCGDIDCHDTDAVVPADFARTLEREVVRLIRRLKRAHETIARYEEQWVDEHI